MHSICPSVVETGEFTYILQDRTGRMQELTHRNNQLHTEIWRLKHNPLASETTQRMRAEIKLNQRRLCEIAYLNRVSCKQRAQTLRYLLEQQPPSSIKPSSGSICPSAVETGEFNGKCSYW